MKEFARAKLIALAVLLAALTAPVSPVGAADKTSFEFAPEHGSKGAWHVTVHLERDVWGVLDNGMEGLVAGYEGALTFRLNSRVDGPNMLGEAEGLSVIEGWTSPEGSGERRLKGGELTSEGVQYGAYDPYTGSISKRERPPFWSFVDKKTTDLFDERAMCKPSGELDWRTLLADYSGVCFTDSVLPLPLPEEPLKKKQNYFVKSGLRRIAGLKLTEPLNVTVAASWSRSDEAGQLFLIRGGAQKQNVRTGVIVPDPVGGGERTLGLELNKLARVHTGEILLNDNCTLKSTHLEFLTDGVLTLDRELLGYKRFRFSEKLIVGFEPKDDTKE